MRRSAVDCPTIDHRGPEFGVIGRKCLEGLKQIFKTEFIEGDWRRAAVPEEIEARLQQDNGHAIKAVCVVHNETSTSLKAFWGWEEMINSNQTGYFPYTPATSLLYGLAEAIDMLVDNEGLVNVFARHQRHAEATRRAVRQDAGPACIRRWR